MLPLWVADMDFAAPPAVVEALRARADHGVFGYSLVPDSLVKAIAGHLASRYGWLIEPDWLCWLPSVVPGLNAALYGTIADSPSVVAADYPGWVYVAATVIGIVGGLGLVLRRYQRVSV